MKKRMKRLKKSDIAFDVIPDVIHQSLIGKEVEISSVEQVIDNKVVVGSAFKEVDPRDNFKKYNVSDFSMENLIAIGASQGLKPTQYTDGDIDGFLGNLEKLNDK